VGTFGRLLGFLRPYRRGVIVSASLAATAMVMTVAIPWLTGRAVDAVRAGAHDARAHHAAARAHDRHQLLMYALAIGAAGVLRLLLTYTRRMIAGQVSLGIEYDLRERLYAHLQRLELSFFDRQQTGQLMSRATVDLQAVRFFLGYGLVFILQSVLSIALAGIAMMLIDPELGLIALAPTPLIVVMAQRYGRRARPAVQEVQQRIAELTAEAEENISGVRVVKAFAREDRQRERFGHSVTRVFDQAMVAARLQARFNPLLAFLPQLGLAAVLLVSGSRVIHGHLTLGQFTSFYFYLVMLLSPVRQLGVTLGLAQRATASGARIFQILDREPRMTAPAGAPGLPPGRGEVRLEGVTLSYAEGEVPPGRPVLRDVDLAVQAGSTTALVGATGSGKTSLVSLLPRLYDPQRGSVVIDGVDVRDVDLRALRAQIAVVSDDPFLFSASVHENIAYARAEVSREEVIEAARRAQAHEFIERLPQGYDTRVGERGLTLSGGQRQRLAIARALIADPRILILDDATSSVDASTEQRIKLALREAMAGRTTFVIAHRLSTIALADDIVVLDEGRIVARGDHDELLEISELYREIVEKGLPERVFLTRRPREAVAGL
jgi:ATP-binding cassette subfamily B protein